MSGDVLERRGPNVLLQAMANGRARYHVSGFRVTNETETHLVTDLLNLSDRKQRERLAEQVPEELRTEVMQVAVELAHEVAGRQQRFAGADGLQVSAAGSTFAALEPSPDPVDGAELLAALRLQVERYVVMSAHAVVACVLWILHTYVADAADYTPYLLLTSPTRACGKSTLLDILEHLAFRALKSAGYTAAALYRRIDKLSPTLLLDELDTRLRGDSGEALRGVLDAGFQRGGKITICVGDEHEVRDFNAFCPKVLAGIGRPWDTVISRSVPIEMQRATKTELSGKQKIRGHLIAEECRRFQQQALRWANDHRQELRDADPLVPNELGARQADVWRQLLAIADLAGGDWPETARTAAKALHGIAEEEGDFGLLLLADTQRIVSVHVSVASGSETEDGDASPPGILTTDLLEQLRAIGDERPWAEYTRDGKAITPRQLAKLFGRFKIKPQNIRAGVVVKKGYRFADLVPAFSRYLSSENDIQPQPGEALHPLQAIEARAVADVADLHLPDGSIVIGGVIRSAEGEALSPEAINAFRLAVRPTVAQSMTSH